MSPAELLTPSLAARIGPVYASTDVREPRVIAVSALVIATLVDQLLGLRHEPDYALEGKIWQPHAPVDLPRAAHLEGEITTVLARIIGQAAARGDSAEAQAEQVLDELHRRGLLRGATEQARHSSTTVETHTQVVPS